MKIPKRIAQTLMNALKGGVVPRVGLPYITVGRKAEIDALLHDVDIIADGGASFRFIVGKYGSGKSFLLQTIRSFCMSKNFVVVDADLSPERRLQGTRGQGLATYKELVRNMSTKTKPEGGALSLILDRWISNVQQEVMAESALSVTDPALAKLVEKKPDTYLAMGLTADRQVAQAVYVGLSTDTGCFRFANTTAHTFATAAACAPAGVDATVVAGVFGGGGHKGAAGATLHMGLEDAARAVEEALVRYQG